MRRDTPTWANGAPGRLRIYDLFRRSLVVETGTGSGDPDAEGGTRDESIFLRDVNTGEEFVVVARMTTGGWPHLLMFRRGEDI